MCWPSSLFPRPLSTNLHPSNNPQMSSEENVINPTVEADMVDAPKGAPQEQRKRPRLDLSTAGDNPRERKRGKSMFGILLGTLNKAKNEDKARNASEAAKKRQLIEQRLQTKLRKETDSVRRAEEAKKHKTAANRKEEELQLKDSIYKLRRTRLPLLANFLSTSDKIPDDINDDDEPSSNPLSQPPRTHPPPLYYLPAILTPAQEAFLTKRKAEVKQTAEKEWELFKEERATGVTEINELRQISAEEQAKAKTEREARQDNMDTDSPLDPHPHSTTSKNNTGISEGKSEDKQHQDQSEAKMDVDDSPPVEKVNETKRSQSPMKKTELTSMPADDDDAVEY